MGIGRTLLEVEPNVLAVLKSLGGGSVFKRTAPAAGRTVKICPTDTDGNLILTVATSS